MSQENKPENANEFTRREWLLRLGEITALAGVAGLVPEFATTLAAAEERASAALPPGLYEPSPKHLIHALSAHGAFAIPPGSETAYVQPRQGPYQPQFFSPDEFRVVTRVAGVLLGKVDAGALAETAEWVDVRLASAAAVRASSVTSAAHPLVLCAASGTADGRIRTHRRPA